MAEKPVQYWWENNGHTLRGYMYEETVKSWYEYDTDRSWWRQIYEHDLPEWVWCVKDNGTDCYKIQTYGDIPGSEEGRWDEDAGVWLPGNNWIQENEAGWDGYQYLAYWEKIHHTDMVLVWEQRKYAISLEDSPYDYEAKKYYYKDGQYFELVDVKFDPIKDNISPWLVDIVNGEWKGAYV